MFTYDKESWIKRWNSEIKNLKENREQLLRLQEQVRLEQINVTQQREQLYPKLQILTNQGSTSDTIPNTTIWPSSQSPYTFQQLLPLISIYQFSDSTD
ncbi:hypothetical protein QTP88_022149 [Uroleucon formosanum]